MTTLVDKLTRADQELIAEEMALHEQVKLGVRDAALAKSPDMNAIKARLVELRDEAISASERDLPALFQQLYTHHSLANRSFEKKLPDMRAPYFAHIRLVEQGKTRDVLIGQQTFIDTTRGVTIIDWRHAVLAKVFFTYKEGDEYEIELPGRVAQGVLAVRRVITFEVGELTAVAGPGYTLSRPRGGAWQRLTGDDAPELGGGAGKAVNVHQFGVGAAARKLPDVSALLDQTQYEILNREDQGALLILGGAGSGKTTVALHRMASLSYKRPRFYRPDAMKVVVPEQGLVRLTQRLLGSLGLFEVSVETYDDWVTDQGRHILKGLPKRLCQWTSPSVVTMKRHPAMFDVVERYIGMLATRLAEKLRFLVKDWHDELVDELTCDQNVPLLDRLMRTEHAAAACVREEAGEGSSWRRNTLEIYFKDARKMLLAVEAARSELYAHPDLLAVLSQASGGRITPRMTDELARHTRRQFEESTNAKLAQDAGESSRSVDGAEVEEDDFAGTMDVEDYTLLLYLMLRLGGRVARKTKSITRYKHLVVDEAQDLSPMEIRLLGQSLAEDATVTVAGDAAQQSDETVSFRGWDDVLAQLEVGDVEEARLSTNYRCPRPVAEFAHQVLGELAPAMPASVREGKPVLITHYPNEGLATVAITEVLNGLLAREHLASVAIVCESEENARRFFDGLRNTVEDLRLVVDGEFEFRPGVDVTDVSQVKGLEFDYVIIPDASAAVYPDTAVARRTLHIAATRAVHQLWVLAVGRPSEILPPAV